MFRSKKYREQWEKILESEDIVAQGRRFLRLDALETEDEEEDFWSKWEKITPDDRLKEAQRAWGGRLEQLLLLYDESDRYKKGLILEVMGYLSEERAANFLIAELSRADESLSLACAAALKRQDPLLILEPMVEAMHSPQSISVARMYDVLEAVGPLLVPLILQRLPEATQKSKLVMLQLLGAFGDETVVEVLVQYALAEDYLLKKAASEALCRFSCDAAFEAMEQLLRDKHWQIRLLAAEVLATREKSLPMLEEALLVEQDKIVKEVLEQGVKALRWEKSGEEPQIWRRIG